METLLERQNQIKLVLKNLFPELDFILKPSPPRNSRNKLKFSVNTGENFAWIVFDFHKTSTEFWSKTWSSIKNNKKRTWIAGSILKETHDIEISTKEISEFTVSSLFISNVLRSLPETYQHLRCTKLKKLLDL